MAELGLRGAVDILSGGMNSTLGGFFEAVGIVMAEYRRRGAALAERDAEIARLRAAAAALLHDLDVNLELSEHFNPPAAELFEHRIYDLRRALAAAPAPADEEGAR